MFRYFIFQIEQIQAEYKVLALQHHPDKNSGDKEAEAKFQKLKVVMIHTLDNKTTEYVVLLIVARSIGHQISNEYFNSCAGHRSQFNSQT